MKIFLGNSQLSWHNNPFIYFIIFVMIISIHLFAIVFDLIGFVEASEYEDSPFGFLNPYIGAGVVASDNLKDLNVHWLRKGGGIMAWGLVEPEKGTFDWEYTDNYIETVTNDNMNVLITIRPTNRWDLESCGKTFYRKKDYTPCSWNDYKNFLEKAFNRYKDRVKYWQIGNEENHRWAETERDYAELVEFTYNTLKENCNDCKLVLSGPSNPEGYYGFYVKVLEELDNISEQGEYYFDIFDFHLFGFYGGYKKYTHPDSGIEYDIKEYGYALD